MPILLREPDIHPVELLDRSETGLEQSWWAMYTKSNREKELMRRLHAMDLCYYAPTIAQKKRSPEGRVRPSFVPLFRNYVFFCGDGFDRYRALTTNCISRDVPVHDAVELVRDLRQIQQLLATGTPVAIESQIEAGRRVRIRSGPLTGYEGTVVQRKGRGRLLIAVKFIQQGMSVEIGDFEVEAI